MSTIQWRNLDFWNARKFAFWFNNKVVGQLTFISFWNYNATYSYQDTILKFSETGVWKRRTVIQQGDKVIALIEKEFFGGYVLQLRTGERFELVSNFFGKNVKWVDQKQNILIKYVQSTFSSINKGTIHFDNKLSEDLKNILTSSGLYTNQIVKRRAALMMILIIFFSATR